MTGVKGNQDKIVDFSRGAYNLDGWFAEWLQQHFFPSTIEYGCFTPELAGKVTGMVASGLSERLESKVYGDIVGEVTRISLELHALPALFYDVHAPARKYPSPESPELVVVPMARVGFKWVYSDRDRTDVPLSPHSQMPLPPAYRMDLLSAVEEGLSPHFMLKAIPPHRQGTFCLGNASFELHSAEIMASLSLFRNGTYQKFDSESYKNVVIFQKYNGEQ